MVSVVVALKKHKSESSKFKKCDRTLRDLSHVNILKNTIKYKIKWSTKIKLSIKNLMFVMYVLIIFFINCSV